MKNVRLKRKNPPAVFGLFKYEWHQTFELQCHEKIMSEYIC